MIAEFFLRQIETKARTDVAADVDIAVADAPIAVDVVSVVMVVVGAGAEPPGRSGSFTGYTIRNSCCVTVIVCQTAKIFRYIE